jgi:enamine deaminase RidA (YjgF/YER057c/UK114 family)
MTSRPTIAKRLDDLGIDLARTLHKPVGKYRNAVEVDGLLYVAGHGPLLDGAPVYRGRVPTDVSLRQAFDAARLTAINCLATIADYLGDLDGVAGFVKVFGMVNADPDFTDHPRVIDGASELLMEVFDDAGIHARSAVGMGSLPFGIPVEIEMIVRLHPGAARQAPGDAR